MEPSQGYVVGYQPGIVEAVSKLSADRRLMHQLSGPLKKHSVDVLIPRREVNSEDSCSCLKQCTN